MLRLLRRLNVPATESQLGVGLAVSALVMGLMLWAILWQSSVIVYQRDLIRWLWSVKAAGG